MNPQTNNYAISKSNRDFDDAAGKNKVILGFPNQYHLSHNELCNKPGDIGILMVPAFIL
jgi:hypothetical protein